MSTLITLESSRPALIDSLREEQASAALQVLSVAAFALLTVLAAQARIYVWEIPFSLQTFVVYGSGLLLGWRSGMLSMLLYLGIGLFFPVFAGDTYGPAYLFGAPSAGYLLAFPVAAAAIGYLSREWKSLAGSVLAMLVGSVIFFACGTFWYHLTMEHLTWGESLMRGWIAFLPLDLAKIFGAGLVYAAIRRW